VGHRSCTLGPMTTAENSTDTRRTPPYVSFTALKKLLNRMAGEAGPPARVDRSYLTGMSGGYQAQILSALRSLNLIDRDGTPSPELKQLTADLDAELPGFMQRKVVEIYPEADALAKGNGSSGQLEESFRSVFGVSGSTLESAIRFYLDASQFAGVPVSAHFKPPARSRPRVKRTKGNTSAKSALSSPAEPSEAPRMGHMPSSTQRVDLGSGGSLVVTATLDLFSLNDEDRTFVFEIVDKVRAYAVKRTPAPVDSPTESSSQDGEAG
jgi:hypothetical protein